MLSILGKIKSKYKQLANLKFPLEIFLSLIFPTNSYNPSNKNRWISCKPLIVPTSMVSIRPLWIKCLAFSKLYLSKCIALIF